MYLVKKYLEQLFSEVRTNGRIKRGITVSPTSPSPNYLIASAHRANSIKQIYIKCGISKTKWRVLSNWSKTSGSTCKANMQIGARRDKLTFFIISKPLLALRKEKKNNVHYCKWRERADASCSSIFRDSNDFFHDTPNCCWYWSFFFRLLLRAKRGVCVFHLHNDNIQLVLKYC